MSAREDLQEAMYGSCFSHEAVDRAIDAFAHELAEQIRDDRPQHNPDWQCWGAAADLIDPS